jgi:hypothetical protein
MSSTYHPKALGVTRVFFSPRLIDTSGYKAWQEEVKPVETMEHYFQNHKRVCLEFLSKA